MIADALKLLFDLVDKSANPKPLDPGDPRKKSYVVNGEIVERFLQPQPRAYQVESLEDLILLANRVIDVPDRVADASPVVWYDGMQVVLVMDDNGHRLERATFLLDCSDAFRTLVGLHEGNNWMDQKAFVQLLRIDLARTMPPAELLDKVRKVRFEGGEVRTATVARQQESLGREINSRVSTEGELPEEVVVSCKVYRNIRESEPLGIRCSVEVDPMRAAFRLRPLPDEIDFVEQIAITQVGELLVGGLHKDIPAYQGKP